MVSWRTTIPVAAINVITPNTAAAIQIDRRRNTPGWSEGVTATDTARSGCPEGCGDGPPADR
jgi:hypothetical protein